MELFSNLATTTLSSAMLSTDTTLSVTSGSSFPSPSTGQQFRITIDSELMIVTGLTGNTFTVTRGAEGTTAVSHSNGTTVRHIITAGSLNTFAQLSGGFVPLTELAGITTSNLSTTAGIVASQIGSINPSTLTGTGTVPIAGLPVATVTTLGLVEIDVASGSPVALTQAGNALPSAMLGTTGTTAAAGNDARLSNARTPTPHETTHLSNGSDAIPWGTVLGSGADASKPTAATSNAGYLWIATDTEKVYQSSGTAWAVVLTATGTSTQIRKVHNVVLDYGADNTGATDATTKIQSALTAAASDGLAVYLPTGTYLIGTGHTGGALFSMSATGIEIFGDGIGKTVLKYANSITIATSGITVFSFIGLRQSIHDMTYVNGTGMTDPSALGFTFCDASSGAYDGHAYNLDVSGLTAGNTSGASGFHTYQNPLTAEESTTLGAAIAAGSNTVTPANMAGIYQGRSLNIGGTAPENVIVTAITATTFTATFVNAHTSTDPVSIYNLGQSRWTFSDCTVHDSYLATGFVVNSNGNKFYRCRVIDVGNPALNTQHGFYIQGGFNHLEGCYVEGVGGFSYHIHIGAGTFPDSSGNTIQGCYSTNPGRQHGISDSQTASGTIPTMAAGIQVQRYSSWIGCVFRTTGGATGVVQAGVGLNLTNASIIEGCVFEDAAPTGGAILANGSSGPTIIKNNLFLDTQNNSNAGHCVAYLSNNSIFEGNTIQWGATPGSTQTGDSNYALRLDGDCSVIDNTILFNYAGRPAIELNGGNNVILANNRATIDGSSTTEFLLANATCTSLDCYGNQILLNATHNPLAFSLGTFAIQGRIHDNVWSSGTGGLSYGDVASTGLAVYDNTGPVQFLGNTVGNLKLEASTQNLLRLPKGTNTLTGQLAVKMVSGLVTNCTTTDTSFMGFATSTAAATSGAVLVAGLPGSVVQGVLVDGPWAIGNIGILSTITAGNLHDTGLTTAPSSGSYVQFLDAGAGAGAGRALVMKTI